VKQLFLVTCISLSFLFSGAFTNSVVHAQSTAHASTANVTQPFITNSDCHTTANSYEIPNSMKSIHDGTLAATFTVSLWYCPALQSNYSHATYTLDNPEPDDETFVNATVSVNRSDGQSASAIKTLNSGADLHNGTQDSPLIFAPVLAAQACVDFSSVHLCTSFF
jgi:hypothetical protein